MRWIRNLADKFGDLATVLEDAGPQISGHIDALRTGAENALSEGYRLRVGDPGYGVDFDKSMAGGSEFDKAVAVDWSINLKRLAVAADDAVASAARSAASAVSDLQKMAPVELARNSSSIDPAKAAQDAKAIIDGSATEEQVDRFNRSMSLTPNQLSDLSQGKSIVLPPAQMQYIKNATGAVDVGSKGLSGIKSFEKFGGPNGNSALRKSLANGLQIVSNRKVESTAGAGSFDNLPKSIKESLTDPNMVVRTHDGKVSFLNRVNDNAALGRLVGSADPKYMAGSDVDRKLMDVGRRYLDVQNEYEQKWPSRPHGQGVDPIIDNYRILKVDGDLRLDNGGTASISPELNDIFGGISHDKVAVHDSLVSGAGNDFVHDLLTTQWKDDGRVAGQLLDFPPSSAVATPGSENFYQANLAGESMGAVAKYIHTDDAWAALKDVPMTGNQSIGQVNPEMLRTLAHSMAPYASELAGANPQDLPGFDGDAVRNTEAGRNFDGASHIFALMGTDREAGHAFYGESLRQMAEEGAKFTSDPGTSSASDHLMAMAHLRALVDNGIVDAANDRSTSDFEAAKGAWEDRQSAFKAFMGLAEKPLDKLPFDDVPGAGALTDVLKDKLEKDFVGDEPDEASFKRNLEQPGLPEYESVLPSRVDGLKTMLVSGYAGDLRSLQSQLPTGFFLENPGLVDLNGHLLPFDPNGELNSEQYLQRVGSILNAMTDGKIVDSDQIAKAYREVRDHGN